MKNNNKFISSSRTPESSPGTSLATKHFAEFGGNLPSIKPLNSRI